MWDIKDFTGTLYTNHETELGHLMQTIYWLDNRQFSEFHDILPWEYHNIADCLKSDMYNFNNWWEIITITPIVNPDDDYCSVITSKFDNVYQGVWSFMQIFDLQLHDAAVTYTYKAANCTDLEESGIYAQIACTLWGYSRQLRVDCQRDNVKNQIANVIFPGME